MRRTEVVQAPETHVETKEATFALLWSVGVQADEAEELLRAAKSPAISSDQASAVCEVLADVVGIPVVKIRDMLTAVPELLATDAAIVASRYETLLAGWPDERQLQKAVCRNPCMLTTSYTSDLNRCMATLVGMGFTPAQTAAAVLRAPSLAQYRRYELATVLQRCGIELKGAAPEVFDLLSKVPECMTPEGNAPLKQMLEVFKEGGVGSAATLETLAKCPKILSTNLEDVQRNIKSLQRWGLSGDELAAVLVGCPAVLRLR